MRGKGWDTLVDPQLYTEYQWTGKEFHVHPRLEETADVLVRPTIWGGASREPSEVSITIISNESKCK